MSDKTVLVIGAHPDDEVLGCGGTISKHHTENADIHVLLVTEGATQQYECDAMVDEKREAATKSADRLGVVEVHFGGLPDMRLDEVAHVECNKVIINVIAAVKPDLVYTYSPHDVNNDHQAVYESTVVATRPPTPVDEVLTYEVPSSTNWVGGNIERFQPDVYVDITGHFDEKMEAFSHYDMEMRSYPHPRSERALRALATTRGSEAGMEMAEAFNLVRKYR